MKLQRIWYILTVFGVLATTFYLGYLFGYRELVDNQEDRLEVVGPNLSIQNSLTQIEMRVIYGAENTRSINNYGRLFFKTESNTRTEVLVSLENVPATVKQADSGQEKAIPNELNIALARRSLDGLDFEYEMIGKLIFDEPKDSVRSGRFSTVYPDDLIGVERLVLLPVDPADENILTDDSPDLPTNVRQRPAPFFWVLI